MAFSKDSIPVYSLARELLYYVPIAKVQTLIDEGRVRPYGTKQRVRSLIAIRGTEEDLRAARPSAGQRYSNNLEDQNNPRGCWHFNLYKSFAYVS